MQKKTAKRFCAGGSSGSVGLSLAGPFRQQAGKAEERESELASHG